MSTAAQLDTFIQEKYIPLQKNIKIGIGLVLIAAPVLVYVFMFHMPNSEKIEALNKQKIQLDKEIQVAKAAAANLERHKAEMESLKQVFLELTTLLPEKQEIPNLLRSISDSGKGAGLDFISFSPGGAVEKDFYAEIPVNINVKGPYHNMGYFLSQVSNLDRIVTVNNIQLGSPTIVQGEVILNSTCRLTTYMFTDKKVTPPSK
ncbi:MAG: type 4a pilus biogenesis protein PilO [Desulfobulbaceae bacterium]|nr:type 4a pilus biogenesis protein PilO [Desulfobulbaceae bacterium]